MYTADEIFRRGRACRWCICSTHVFGAVNFVMVSQSPLARELGEPHVIHACVGDHLQRRQHCHMPAAFTEFFICMLLWLRLTLLLAPDVFRDPAYPVQR